MNKKTKIVAYVPDSMKQYVVEESKRLGMTESTFVRFVILGYKANNRDN
jgi:hypothetical protein